jgi:hypothetical protein
MPIMTVRQSVQDKTKSQGGDVFTLKALRSGFTDVLIIAGALSL